MDYNMQYFFKQQKFFLDQVAYLQSRLKLRKALDAEIEELLEKIDHNQIILSSDLNNLIASQETDNSSASQQ